jgi:hypothetical protein
MAKGRRFGEQLFRNQQVRGSSPRAGSKTLAKSAILDVTHIDLFISTHAGDDAIGEAEGWVNVSGND